jgi:hypothetical protein
VDTLAVAFHRLLHAHLQRRCLLPTAGDLLIARLEDPLGGPEEEHVHRPHEAKEEDDLNQEGQVRQDLKHDDVLFAGSERIGLGEESGLASPGAGVSRAIDPGAAVRSWLPQRGLKRRDSLT